MTRRRRNGARRLAGDRLRDRRDMVGRGAAAAAHDIHQARTRELAQELGHEFRAFVVEPELVRQAGIRIGAGQGIGDARDLGDMGAHLLGAERAIEADRHRRGVTDRIPEGFRRLARQHAAGAVRDGAGDHHRHAQAPRVEQLLDGVDRRLGVERVEDGLQQQQVGAAVEQSARLLRIGDAQAVERGGAEAGIADVGRYRGGPVGRPDGARDETRPAVLLARRQRRLARELRAREVELIGDVFHAVVGLGDRGRREGVGRHDVGAGPQIGEMDVADRVRPGEVQQVVVAADLAVPGVETGAAITLLIETERLDHGPHGAVEHQDALSGKPAQRGFGWRTKHGHCSSLRQLPRPRGERVGVRGLGPMPF